MKLRALLVALLAPAAILIACAAIDKIDPVNSVPPTPCGDASCPTGGGYYYCDLYGKCQASSEPPANSWGENSRAPNRDAGVADAGLADVWAGKRVVEP